jgi:hypothetical protein
MSNTVVKERFSYNLVRSGRRSRFADKVSVYIVIVPQSATEDEIREFCTTRVCVCKHDSKSERMFNESYYELSRIDDTTYRYTVTQPYVD